MKNSINITMDKFSTLNMYKLFSYPKSTMSLIFPVLYTIKIICIILMMVLKYTSVSFLQTQLVMTRFIKSGIPMSPLSLSRQSSAEHFLSSSPESCSISSPSISNTWQALCECEMIVELIASNDLDLTAGEGEDHLKVSYEIVTNPNWAISGAKEGKAVSYQVFLFTLH
mgnify:FL=1